MQRALGVKTNGQVLQIQGREQEEGQVGSKGTTCLPLGRPTLCSHVTVNSHRSVINSAQRYYGYYVDAPQLALTSLYGPPVFYGNLIREVGSC